MRSALTLLVAVACSTRIAAADPAIGRVVTAPTAWLPAGHGVVASAGLDHRLDGNLVVSYGLGGLAAVELGTDTDVRGCVDCTARPEPLWLGRAAFRLGARQDAWFRGMPALVLGVRTTVSALSRRGELDRARVGEGYAVASREIGPVRVHAGASLLDASAGETTLGPTLRPLAGLEWTPSQYPRTTLMGDLAWVALFAGDQPRTEWVGGWGVRFQALSWGSIELLVRHREDEALGDSTVLIRVNGVLAGAGAPSGAAGSGKNVTHPR